MSIDSGILGPICVSKFATTTTTRAFIRVLELEFEEIVTKSIPATRVVTQ